jgi:hypothetical protein
MALVYTHVAFFVILNGISKAPKGWLYIDGVKDNGRILLISPGILSLIATGT